jgi:hypothetical protein
MSSAKCEGDLSANRRSLASTPSALSSASNWAAFIGHAAILSPIKAGLRARWPASIAGRGHVWVVDLRGVEVPPVGFIAAVLPAIAVAVPVRPRGFAHHTYFVSPLVSATGIASTRFFAVRYDTAVSVGRLRSCHRKPGAGPGGARNFVRPLRVEGRCRAVAHSVASGGLMKRSAEAAIRRRGEAGPSWRPGVISHHDGKFEFDPGSNGQEQAKSP